MYKFDNHKLELCSEANPGNIHLNTNTTDKFIIQQNNFLIPGLKHNPSSCD